MSNYVKKKDMRFQNPKALSQVQNVIDEAEIAIQDENRTISTSSIPEVLAGVVGVGAGGAISFAALYFGGIAGLSAAGITSGLAVAGGLVGGGMAAGLAVIAAPVALLGAAGVGISAHARNKRLREMKELCYREAIKKQTAILKALKDEINADKERIEYLNSLNVLLRSAINDLKHDLGIA